MNEAVELMNREEAPGQEATRAISENLLAAFQKQRKSYLADPIPGLEQRKNDLNALKKMLNENLDAIVDAICEDYGNRSRHESLFAEVIAVTDGINDTVKKLKKWMKPQKRHVDITLYPGAKNRVIPQPLGVVGLIIPWNFPVNLSFSQLTAVFAAGNRAMVKMSENSRALTRVLMEISPKYFPEEKLMWFEETGGVGIEFSQIPFDLIIFTGSGQTGRAVMASAAKNLTPVVLELGGKSPAVIDPEVQRGTNLHQCRLRIRARKPARGIRREEPGVGEQARTRYQQPGLHLDHRRPFVPPAGGNAGGWARKRCDPGQPERRTGSEPRIA
jgi:coniferyl-aldehyde dehydrogenase